MTDDSYYNWQPGETVRIKDGITDPVQGMIQGGAVYIIEDLWQKVAGKSWMDCEGNPAALHYAMRSAMNGFLLPMDDDVLYGHTPNGLGHLVHISEIEAYSE